MFVYVVSYQESNYDPESIIKIFDSNEKAEAYIDSMNNMPDAVNGYANDDKYNPDYLDIAIYELE